MKRDLPCVTCVFFEGEAKQSNLFTSNSVEETVNYPAGKPPPLVLIHVYHLTKTQTDIENKVNTERKHLQESTKLCAMLCCSHLLPV